MRFLTIPLLSALIAFPALAQDQRDPNRDLIRPQVEEKTAPSKPALFTLGDDLDTLFSQLKRTAAQARAKRIANRIWTLWQTSDSRSIDLLTHWARVAMEKKDYVKAMDLLDQVVVMRPTYAEGWNQRATLHYLREDYGKSIADIERTLALEPRHFGALAGLANIQQRLGDEAAALKSWYKVLEVYPANKDGQKAVIALEEKLEGRRL